MRAFPHHFYYFPKSLNSLFSRNLQRFCPLFQSSNASTSAHKMERLDQTQVSYLKEECILVDEHDNVVGSASKGDCHRKETGESGFFDWTF